MATARTRRDWATAAEHLAGQNSAAERLHARHGPPTDIGLTRPEDRFHKVARAIAYQQLSGKAAGTIFVRVQDAVGEPFSADTLSTTTHEELRSAGLSNAKARALADLADKTLAGELTLSTAGYRSDAEVIEHLCQVRGIGPWTAQMFLMFDLGRTDVWPAGDLAVRSGYAMAMGLDTAPNEKEMAGLGELFAPHRSVMAWWCWREVDTEEGPW